MDVFEGTRRQLARKADERLACRLMFSHSFPDEPIILEIAPVESGAVTYKDMQAVDTLVAADPKLTVDYRLISGFTDAAHLQSFKVQLQPIVEAKAQIVTHFAYRRTLIADKVIETKFVRQTGGMSQYAHLWLRFEPLPDNPRIIFEIQPEQQIPETGFLSSIFEDINKPFIRPIFSGIRNFSEIHPPFIIGFKATLLDGKIHDVDSSEFSHKASGAMALKNAIEQIGTIIIEPIMRLQLNIPAALGDAVLRDLHQRSVNLTPQLADDRYVIDGEANLSNLYDFRATFAKLTDGQGTLEMARLRYREVAPETLRTF